MPVYITVCITFIGRKLTNRFISCSNSKLLYLLAQFLLLQMECASNNNLSNKISGEQDQKSPNHSSSARNSTTTSSPSLTTSATNNNTNVSLTLLCKKIYARSDVFVKCDEKCFYLKIHCR